MRVALLHDLQIGCQSNPVKQFARQAAELLPRGGVRKVLTEFPGREVYERQWLPVC